MTLKHSPANDNDPFWRLPMFAKDLELAEAIVGKSEAAKWVKERLPTLAVKPGFPPVDAFHGGRPVPLVRMFYQSYLGVATGMVGSPDGEEGQWSRLRQ
ncbi:hypothetical protein [Rhizobium sp. Root482]|uniref:hypothetical protein n=1 Tax=Rhizobium sp. Root482 TaxID=1736543 RepID=UPI000A759581|nr:hypothetical protein [Rhizobium sp. Root482]